MQPQLSNVFESPQNKKKLNSCYVTNRKKKQKGTVIIFEALLFLVYNHVTSRPCWWSIQYNFFSKNFSSFWKVRFFVIVYCFVMFLWQQDALQCIWEKTNPINEVEFHCNFLSIVTKSFISSVVWVTGIQITSVFY